MSKQQNPRAAAARLCWQIIDKGYSLDAAVSDYFGAHELTAADRGLTQELVYGVCRWYGELDVTATALLKKPIRNKDRVIHFVLLVGLYQLRHLGTPAHAAVAESVAACQQLNKGWAKQLINGCLRQYLRDQPEPPLPDQAAATRRSQLSHPAWMVEAIGKAWPEYVDAVLEANDQRPPMCLRVNRRYGSGDDARAQYLQRLIAANIPAAADPFSADGIVLTKAVGVGMLPDFENGAVSVQDTAAQLACDILGVQAGQVVLDACAAPGGKTAHILERTDNRVTMHALDISEHRCEQLHNTLARLKLQAQVFTADASQCPSGSLSGWQAPQQGYDRILIDAPCSGLGVIRRHPDIKHHRRASDLENLTRLQQQLLNQLWLLLKPGGQMLYMTCSVLPAENLEQIKAFMQNHEGAQAADFSHPHALDLEFGKQTLPGVHAMDGFYYCLIRKNDA